MSMPPAASLRRARALPAVPGASVLSVADVALSYGQTMVLRDLALDVREGEMVALLGRNGAGKSTLLRLLSGVLAPQQGIVRLDGAPIGGLNRRAIARRLAVVPQQLQVPFAFNVREVTSLGRTAHVPFLAAESARDRAAVADVLDLLDLTGLAERSYNTLSGGEQQRVVLAMALCQLWRQPGILLLDEPTVHLDVAHQRAVLRLTRRLHDDREHGLTVLAAVHDLNMAALYFDRLLLLKDGRLHADGPPWTVLTVEAIRDVFGVDARIAPHPTVDAPQVTLLP